MKKNKKISLMLIIISIVFIANTYVVFGQNKKDKTVKVGWFILNGFQDVDRSGNYSGYNYDYLKKLNKIRT